MEELLYSTIDGLVADQDVDATLGTLRAHATSALPAAPTVVRRLIVDPLALPSWNPAFQSIDGPSQPAAGTRYAIRVRPGLTGWLEYSRIG